jgi:hypothetical protein
MSEPEGYERSLMRMTEESNESTDAACGSRKFGCSGRNDRGQSSFGHREKQVRSSDQADVGLPTEKHPQAGGKY